MELDSKREVLEIVHRVAQLSKASREIALTVDPSRRTVADLVALVDFTTFADVPATDRKALLASIKSVTGADKAVGALVGLAVADALGAPFEFMPAVDQPGATGAYFDLPSFTAVGIEKAPEMTLAKKLKDGQWTDDTSMALCLADSLLMGRYCGADVRVRFWNWWHRGYNNAFRNDKDRESRRSIGLGGNVGKSLDAINDAAPPPRYLVRSEDSGNGSLMRLAPVPIAFLKNIEKAMAVSAESSLTTHPGRIAASACHFLGFIVCRALSSSDQTAQQFLDAHVQEYLDNYALAHSTLLRKLLFSSEPLGSKELCWNWKSPSLQIEATLEARAKDGDYNGYPVNRGYFGSYCMDGLAIALHSFYSTDSFNEAITRCVNFLGDADSTAAICGQIAGAFYGFSAIDPRFVQRLERWDDKEIACKAVLLWALGADADSFEEPEELFANVCEIEIERTPELTRLMEMGYSIAEADDALKRAGGDLEQAAQILLLGE